MVQRVICDCSNEIYDNYQKKSKRSIIICDCFLGRDSGSVCGFWIYFLVMEDASFLHCFPIWEVASLLYDFLSLEAAIGCRHEKPFLIDILLIPRQLGAGGLNPKS